jgi:signal transduction histidine kinase
LSVSFGIIRDFGGAIKVESEQGKFTRFVIELSAANQQRPAFICG